MTTQGPLPIVDEGRVLQQESIHALNAILPPRDYIFRDERTEDYGVDGSLELLVEGKATNIRAQIQLKGRSNTIVKQDGSVSVQVRTRNLNYLLNGICPLYVLYRPEARELRAAFARDEWKRLEQVNPTWRDQDTVTIQFRQVLTSETLVKLNERISQDAQLRRSVDERVNCHRSGTGQIVIDPKTLQVVDSKELLNLMAQMGQSLTNSGLARVVVERARPIRTSDLLAVPAAALAVAYAHFHLAHYYDASAALRQLILSKPVLDANSRSLLEILHISTRRMLSELDDERYEREMGKWLANAPPELAIQQEIADAWSAHTKVVSTLDMGPNYERTKTRLKEVLERGKRIGSPLARYTIELQELTLLQHEVSDALIDAQALREFASRGQGDAHHARVRLRESTTAATDWLNRLKALADQARVEAPQIHCEALLLRTHAVLSKAMQLQLESQAGYGLPLTATEIDAVYAGIY